MSKRTITLTGRAPVRIEDDNWEVIAKATDSEHDGQVECQANRKSSWAIRVRQHEDGRVIVSAVYDYDTHYQGERSLQAKRGVLLGSGCDIVAAIREVCQDISEAEHAGDDADRWSTLCAECIADLPAEDLD